MNDVSHEYLVLIYRTFYAIARKKTQITQAEYSNLLWLRNFLHGKAWISCVSHWFCLFSYLSHRKCWMGNYRRWVGNIRYGNFWRESASGVSIVSGIWFAMAFVWFVRKAKIKSWKSKAAQSGKNGLTIKIESVEWTPLRSTPGTLILSVFLIISLWIVTVPIRAMSSAPLM